MFDVSRLNERMKERKEDIMNLKEWIGKQNSLDGTSYCVML
jgi:hypothetical protein